jgi:hypothetical protein
MTRLCLSALTTIWLCGNALAQSTPEIREILSRLKALEEANHALTDEVRALRTELAVARGPSSSSPSVPVAPTAERTEEQISVQTARVEDLAQSKVEASQKLPLRLTGMVVFNAYMNGRLNGGFENPILASAGPWNATGGGTLRQSVLGLQYESPQTVFGAKVSGSLYMDFFGGSTSSLNHLMRLRTATVSLDWNGTSIMFGQDKPLISPRDPNSYAQIGVSPLTGAGNLWLWQPQVRIEHDFKFGRDFGLRAQAAVIQTRQLGDSTDNNGYSPYLPPPVTPLPIEQAQPGVEGRFEVWGRWGENRRIEIAPGFHENGSTAGSSDISSRLFSVDWLIKPIEHFEFSGAFFNGQNVANLGALPQGFIVGQYDHAAAVHSTGGWAQIRIPVTDRLSFNIYGGQQNDQRNQLLFGNIGINQSYAANAMYRIAPNVIVSLEGGQVRTTYIGIGNRLNNHYDLAIAYLF